MPKHPPQAHHTPKRRSGTKRVVVEDRVRFASDTLFTADREAVERATASWENFRELTHNRRGVGSTGKLRAARVSPGVRLIYRESPTQVTVLDLVNEGTFDALGITTYPPRPARRRKMKVVREAL